MTKSKIWKGSLISKAEFLLQWGLIASRSQEYSLVLCSPYFWGKKGPYWFRSKSLTSSFLKASFMRMTGIGWMLFSESKGYCTSTFKGFFQKIQWDTETLLSMSNFSTDTTCENSQTSCHFKDDKYISKCQWKHRFHLAVLCEHG